MSKTTNTLPRQINEPAHRFGNPVAAAVQIFAGAMVALDATGNALPADPAQPVMRGIALSYVDNRDGVAGDASVETTRGAFIVKNDGTIDRTFISKNVFVVDDETVGAAGTLIAGKCLDVTPLGVAVEFV